MAYLVMARKWRPKTFSEVIGQEHVTVTLENAIKNNRLASAYLFSGPRGVGKTTTARILAKALNCEKGPTATPCNTCVACQEISEGRSIDVLEIDGASNRGIDEVRSLRESTRYTPSSLRYKIYIIDEVHMLTTEAFNALLKTLEEPPPHVVFIFATTEVNKVPATILSRCQRFDFRRIPVDKIIQQLEMICQQENIQVDPGAMHLIAKKAEGCMRDSESLLDQVVSFCGSHVKETDVISLFGMIHQDLYFDLTRAISEKNVPKLMELAQQIYMQGYDFNDVIAGLAEHLHALLLYKTTQSRDHLPGVEAYHEAFEKAANDFNETDLIRMIQLLNEAAFNIRRSSNAQLLFESLLVRLARLPASLDLQQILADLQELKKKASHETPPFPGVKVIPEIAAEKLAGGLFNRINGTLQTKNEKGGEAPTSSQEPQSVQAPAMAEIQQAWPDILARVKKKKVHLGSLLEEGTPVRLVGNKLDIAFDGKNGYHIHSLNDHRRLIETAIRESLGKPVLIYCVERQALQVQSEAEAVETTAEELPGEDAPGQMVSDDWLQQEPLAQKLIESLGGQPIEP
ncbi:MAG: DNA polymerase III subunit gamma/tau [Calditrichaeota bacterium]|nr:MAG: DNA polymerase III subunit gamma/tau [Calditrichota bacterium]